MPARAGLNLSANFADLRAPLILESSLGCSDAGEGTAAGFSTGFVTDSAGFATLDFVAGFIANDPELGSSAGVLDFSGIFVSDEAFMANGAGAGTSANLLGFSGTFT